MKETPTLGSDTDIPSLSGSCGEMGPLFNNLEALCGPLGTDALTMRSWGTRQCCQPKGRYLPE
jgi:hypothetical protein